MKTNSVLFAVKKIETAKNINATPGKKKFLQTPKNIKMLYGTKLPRLLRNMYSNFNLWEP